MNISVLVLVSLLAVLVVLAVGVYANAPDGNGSALAGGTGVTEPPETPPEEPDETPSQELPEAPGEDGCTDGLGGDHCEDEGSPAEEDPTAEDPIPAGYELHEDTRGFAFYLPEGWRRDDEGLSEDVFYYQGDRSRLIRITDFGGVHGSPEEAMQALKSEHQGRPGYSVHENSRRYLGRESLNMEIDYEYHINYLYDHDELGPREVYARTFLGGDGKVYMVLAAGPQHDWGPTERLHARAADSFCVTGHDCP
ncbi:photosystem II reaction center PsbP family protein [Nocardiopsis dassonvillei]|uniref:photosystem II reaction center PsbP family protein n=1 Tax=Nocardiopsis dassonvillei TaxID=2014 RepID=UPI0020A467CC|nr:photosystem II reaction center PsbP family protein [Nocardiopsis dassonvillei]MCP3013063.1 photosystem II reaction center PsbP family protein [Nocardiopsis dassonvillei]